ncbi:hypothetical protein GCM10028808_50480 [Spirosoma migulaei]
MDCSICTAINIDTHLPQNKVLFESKSFILLPTIGPLVAGHAMLASKLHYESLGQMGLEAINEFKGILSYFENKFSFFSNMLITEHGSYNQQKGGACVIHTHIHLIPNYSDCYNILDEILPELENPELTNLATTHAPYILNMNSQGDLKIYEAYNSYSQIVRKAICNKYKRYDSDWAADSKPELIQETINVWKF